jgi:hypothetical protein
MPSYTSGVAGQDIPNSIRVGAGGPVGRAVLFRAALVLTGCIAPVTWAAAAERPSKDLAANDRTSTAAAANGAAELFSAIDKGTVEVKVVVRDQYHARVILRNKTDAPLTLRLPDAFAARPVLAQQNFGFPSTGQNQNQGQSQPQAVSGPFGSQSSSQGFNFGSGQGQGANNNFFGNNNNVFNIPPESVRSVRVACFCVELGKPNPRSIHSYELVKFDEVGGDPQLAALFERYARGDLDREAVQAAVWHVANEKSWDELGKLTRRVALNADAPIFTRRQLEFARDLVAYAARQAAEHPERYAADPASLAKSDDSSSAESAGADRIVPSSAEKYRTVRGINARR